MRFTLSFIACAYASASNVCPAGYSRTGNTSSCYKVTDGASSLAECFELCDGGGAPACITSLEEQAQASALSVAPLEVFVSQIGSLWVGNHQPDSLGGARCLDGSTAALPSSPTANQYATCTLLYTGELVPTICNSRTMKLHRCLCDANATVASDALGFLAAWDETDMILRGRISLVTLLIMLILAPLPVLIVRCCRCCRGARSAGMHTAKVSDGGGATVGAGDSKSTIQSARLQAQDLHERMNRRLAFFGWAALVVALGPSMHPAGAYPIPGSTGLHFGPYTMYWVLMAPAVVTMFLSVAPVHERAVRYSCRAFFLFNAFFFFMTNSIALRQLREGGDAITIIVWFNPLGIVYAVYLLPTLCFGSGDATNSPRGWLCRTLPPRASLRRLWLLIRLTFIQLGLLTTTTVISVAATTPGHLDTSKLTKRIELGRMLFGIVSLIVMAVLTPTNRGRILVWVCDVAAGKAASTQQEAAAIAALVGRGDASQLLEKAGGIFCGLRFDRLLASDLQSNTAKAAASSEPGADGLSLQERTEKLALGDCEAFFSHSWSDDGERKHAALVKWAGSFAASHEGRTPRLWLDKACIDQSNISESLSCLPIFLAGCQQLLIVAGPTYPTRLWCLLECFTFVKMGGELSRVQVDTLEGDEVEQSLMQMDAATARCFLERDRQHLLAVIETGFGDAQRFNLVLRDIFSMKGVAGTATAAPSLAMPNGETKKGDKYRARAAE